MAVWIGLAGLNGAGKGEVIRHLERWSFHSVSLSDVIRQDLAEDELEPTRAHMIERGRALRERLGAGALAERVIGGLAPNCNHVIDSVRTPAEVETLRAAGDFRLWWIEAPAKIRFERIRQRARSGDAETFEAFEAQQARELESRDPAGQQLLRVRDLADELIPNSRDLEALHRRLDDLLRNSLFFRERPSWDQYFMSLAQVASTRSNCIKRKVGAVVVIDRRVVSTGYNGTPRGVRNCNEGGCPRCAGGAESGTRLDECLCSHAEENVITQAAYHGVSLRGSMVYTTLFPCLICAKLIINAGVSEVVYEAPFPVMESSQSLLVEAGVKIRTTLESGVA